MKLTQPSQPHRCLIVTINSILCFLLCLSLADLQMASAAPPTIHYYVDRFDEASINSGCTDEVDDNTCGLRGAITLINTTGSHSYYHQINLPAGTYTMSLPGYDDANSIGDLDIYGPTTIIEGNDDSDTIITQSGTFDRILDHRGDHSLRLMNLTIQGGSLPTGQGGGGGLRSLDAYTLTLENVKFYNNHVAGSDPGDRGGGVYIQNTNLVANHYTIYQDNTACDGGGMAIYNSSSSVTTSFDDPLFDGNTATCGSGGGLDLSGIVNLSMVSPSFAYNHAKFGAGYYDSTQTDATMNDVMCYSNVIDSGGTGAACMDVYGILNVSDSMFFGNDAQSGPGGIYLKSSSEFTLTDSKIYENTGEDAGAILAVNNTSAVLQRVQITDNTAINGGGISVGTSGNINLENVTIAGNTAEGGAVGENNGGGLWLSENTPPISTM